MSVSGLALLTISLFSSLLQNLEKSWSLMRCQTSLKGASMTADSLTEVEVGMRVLDMIAGAVTVVCGRVSGKLGAADQLGRGRSK